MASYRRASSGCWHWDIRSYYALQSHVVTSLEVFIFMTSVTPYPLLPATYGTAASGQSLLAVDENATNDLPRRKRGLSGDGGQ
jgi:hypothetical protein